MFHAFMNLVIVLAGALVGIQTYSGMENSIIIKALDSVILVTFVIECAMAICADPLRPWNYWIGPAWAWHNFDFFIVVSCLVLPGSSSAALRLLRLLRLVELFRNNAQMKMIVGGLIEGLGSAVFVLVLLFLIFYMYAAFGVVFFSQGDPWHFGDLMVAFVTLYRITTLDGWSELLYINYFGCEEYPGIKRAYVTEAQLVEQNRTLWQGEKICISEPWPMTSFVYFQSFIVLCTLICLSLFIGIMTIAMINIIRAMAGAERQKAKEKELACKEKVYGRLFAGVDAKDSTTLILKERQKVFKICKALAVAIGGEFDHKFRDHEAHMMDGSCCTYYVHFALACRTISHSSIFSGFIATVIVFGGIEVGLQADNVHDSNHFIESSISGIFITEAVMKILGEMTTPWRYGSNTSRTVHCRTSRTVHCRTSRTVHCRTARTVHCRTARTVHCRTARTAHCRLHCSPPFPSSLIPFLSPLPIPPIDQVFGGPMESVRFLRHLNQLRRRPPRAAAACDETTAHHSQAAAHCQHNSQLIFVHHLHWRDPWDGILSFRNRRLHFVWRE
jgi:voltage-gated sodium channel